MLATRHNAIQQPQQMLRSQSNNMQHRPNKDFFAVAPKEKTAIKVLPAKNMGTLNLTPQESS